MNVARALLGVAVLCLLAWLLSTDRKQVPWRVLAGGLGLQWLLGFLVLGTSWGRGVFGTAGDDCVETNSSGEEMDMEKGKSCTTVCRDDYVAITKHKCEQEGLRQGRCVPVPGLPPSVHEWKTRTFRYPAF